MIRRGDIVPVVQAGSYGKPRPALVIQSDLFSVHPSLSILPLTSTLRDTPLFRIRIEPDPKNGLKAVSEIMVDKITTVPREKAGRPFGYLDPDAMREVRRLLAVWLGFC